VSACHGSEYVVLKKSKGHSIIPFRRRLHNWFVEEDRKGGRFVWRETVCEDDTHMHSFCPEETLHVSLTAWQEEAIFEEKDEHKLFILFFFSSVLFCLSFYSLEVELNCKELYILSQVFYSFLRNQVSRNASDRISYWNKIRRRNSLLSIHHSNSFPCNTHFYGNWYTFTQRAWSRCSDKRKSIAFLYPFL